MTRPPRRDKLPERDDTRRKRWLYKIEQVNELCERFKGIRYRCAGKHKANPYLYDVDPYHGTDSDRTLCDRHAGFCKEDLPRIRNLLRRAKAARLAGNLTWSVDDTGWIYELQTTNIGQNEWHGYPMLTNDPFARTVWLRFKVWADECGKAPDRNAASACASLYGLNP
ncbi:hypothetical protein P7L66_01225 (plasmid) [Tistrella mobilis]|uniref:hypothetical protein n=1 Tax=Tistrella mobilis TaxID=171437 RepID=UPI003556386E